MIQGGSSTAQKPKGHVDFKSAFYFQTPVWIAEAPMFLKNAIKVTDKYIKKADKLLKDKLKNEPKWKKDIGTFGLSKHSESFSADPKVRDLVQFIGQRSYEFLDWSGFNLKNHSFLISASRASFMTLFNFDELWSDFRDYYFFRKWNTMEMCLMFVLSQHFRIFC